MVDSDIRAEDDVRFDTKNDTELERLSPTFANGVDMSLEKRDLPYWKIEPVLLAELKSVDTVEVVITATDMSEVRWLLGIENPNHHFETKGPDKRLETSILEVQSHMLPKIASLESVVSIQSYRLPEPPPAAIWSWFAWFCASVHLL